METLFIETIRVAKLIIAALEVWTPIRLDTLYCHTPSHTYHILSHPLTYPILHPLTYPFSHPLPHTLSITTLSTSTLLP